MRGRCLRSRAPPAADAGSLGGHLDVLRGTWKPHPPRILLERQEAARRFFPCLSIVLDALEVQHLLHACGGEMSGKGQAVSNRDTASELPVGGGGEVPGAQALSTGPNTSTV